MQAAITRAAATDPLAFVQWVNEGFLDQFVTIADTYSSLFEDISGHTDEWCVTRGALPLILPVSSLFHPRCRLSLSSVTRRRCWRRYWRRCCGCRCRCRCRWLCRYRCHCHCRRRCHHHRCHHTSTGTPFNALCDHCVGGVADAASRSDDWPTCSSCRCPRSSSASTLTA